MFELASEVSWRVDDDDMLIGTNGTGKEVSCRIECVRNCYWISGVSRVESGVRVLGPMWTCGVVVTTPDHWRRQDRMLEAEGPRQRGTQAPYLSITRLDLVTLSGGPTTNLGL